eukprot:TRINITY_DN21730_c0_g1_i1.p1 TRINITY_DN21730_c0_g1~~TRINITY_DN21730_c0_g1_i1.p1  ORF type:complete len:139 (-),score=28.39 TRINITY_DN21730_c0_g1_i1:416-832(-)
MAAKFLMDCGIVAIDFSAPLFLEKCQTHPSCKGFFASRPAIFRTYRVCAAPDEERATRRSPLDFPLEWERPPPGRRPDIAPTFSPLKTPLPQPLPSDPPEKEDTEGDEEEEGDPEELPEEQPSPDDFMMFDQVCTQCL